MDKKLITKEYNKKIKLINYHNKKYYNKNNPKITDSEFDDLKKSPIIKAMNAGKNIIVTPHIGGMTYEGQLKAYKWAINKL